MSKPVRGKHVPIEQIDVGLAILQTLPQPSRGFWRQHEIAAVCGVSKTAIEHRERVAMAKLRRAAMERGML